MPSTNSRRLAESSDSKHPMANIDLVVLLVILVGTCVGAIILWRSGARYLRLLVGAWLVFYGLVLTAMMVAHSIDILYSTYAGGLTMDGVPWAYDFRTYGLHLLGAVLIWQGVRSIRAAHVVGRGGSLFSKEAMQAASLTLLIVLPLIPIHAVFAMLLTGLSIVTVVVLVVGRVRSAVPAARDPYRQ